MLNKSMTDAMAQRDEYELRTFAARELHCWHEIAVRRHENNHLSMPFQREAGDIQPNPHVDALLPDVRLQVIRTDMCDVPRPVQHSVAQPPSFKMQLAEAQREERFTHKGGLDTLVARSGRS